MRTPKKTTLEFLIINTVKLLAILKMPLYDYDTYIIRGCRYSELKEAEGLYRKLNGRYFSNIQKIILKLFSKKNLIVTIDKSTNKIIALNFYYLNHRDFIENTIHGGFIGVLPQYEGQGIATNMRKLAKSHFEKVGFTGISSRISKNNIASLKTAKKVGFIPVEDYFDTVMNEDRYYLICNLKEKK